MARSITSTFDPDDLVAESFTRIFHILQKGKGPNGAFRPYLFTTIRNTAASWGRARRETSLDSLEAFEDPTSSDDATLAALDSGLTATAFRSLPTRWQEVLWYSEVEAMTPAQIAPLLGMSANSVSALAYRAREGLRQAWITAHLNSNSASEECRWSIEHLGAYTRESLSARDTKRLELHLDECARCTIAASEAHEVGSRLALVLLPLSAGASGAAAYTHWLQTGGPAEHTAAVMPMPDSVTGGLSATITPPPPASSAASSSAASSSASAMSASTITTASVVGGLILAASVVAAVALGPSLFSPGDTATEQTASDLPSTTEQAIDNGSDRPEQVLSVQPDAVTQPAPAVPAPELPVPEVFEEPAEGSDSTANLALTLKLPPHP